MPERPDGLTIPLPPTLAKLLPYVEVSPADDQSADGPTLLNPSLLFDRGFDRYETSNGRVTVAERDRRDGKTDFLAAFAEEFGRGTEVDRAAAAEYSLFFERRKRAFERLDARRLTLHTRSRLVCGMGLPHPTGNGLLLDRLTGCPYLPGSTVKGLLRAAAALVAEGELEIEDPNGAGDAAFWKEHLHRIFGPDRTAPEPARGQVVFYDAFPTEWPKLEVDVLTPHYQPYYANGDAPGDWHDPIPVTFLTVRSGTPFEFAFQAAPLPHAPQDEEQDPLPRLARLLPVALDWLGVGGKKSSGYGVFGKEPLPKPFQEPETTSDTRGRKKKRPKSPKKVQAVLWKNRTLELAGPNAVVWRNKKESATCDKDDLDPRLLKKLRRETRLTVDVRVIPQSGGHFRIASVQEVS